MQSTRNKILLATVGFIKDDSNYEQLTLSKIALAANIGKSTVYDYFKSKEELFEETSLFLLSYYDEIVFQDLTNNNFSQSFHEQVKRLIFVVRDARIITDAVFNHHSENITTINSKKIETRIDEFQEKLNLRFQEIFMLAVNENIIYNQNKEKYKKHVILAIISGLLYQHVNNKIDIEENELISLIEKNCIIIINA